MDQTSYCLLAVAGIRNTTVGLTVFLQTLLFLFQPAACPCRVYCQHVNEHRVGFCVCHHVGFQGRRSTEFSSDCDQMTHFQ